MADVIITMKIMPESPELDLDVIETEALGLIKEFTEMDNHKSEKEPLAFGLKALKIMFVMDESKGSTQSLEDEISNLEGVTSVEITDVRRALG